MAPQPYTCNGRITLEYTVLAFLHKMRFPVQVVDFTVAIPELQCWPTSSSPTSLWTAAIQHAWTLISGEYSNTVLAPTAVLEQRAGGVFVPVASVVMSAGGTNVAASAITNECTLTYKSTANHTFKLKLLEGIDKAPFHDTYPTGGIALDAIIPDVITPGAGHNMNDWLRSRGSEQLSRFTFATAGLNKKLRRSRHLE